MVPQASDLRAWLGQKRRTATIYCNRDLVLERNKEARELRQMEKG